MTGQGIEQERAARASLWSSVLASTSELSDARRAAAADLTHAGYSRDLIDDVNLIVTELTVNALTHGVAGQVDIDIDRGPTGAGLVITVSHDEGEAVDGFHIADPPVMAAPSAWAGRGRAIVAAVSDRFETRRQPPGRVENVVTIHT